LLTGVTCANHQPCRAGLEKRHAVGFEQDGKAQRIAIERDQRTRIGARQRDLTNPRKHLRCCVHGFDPPNIKIISLTN
jgi:hypothetical protein